MKKTGEMIETNQFMKDGKINNGEARKRLCRVNSEEKAVREKVVNQLDQNVYCVE